MRIRELYVLCFCAHISGSNTSYIRSVVNRALSALHAFNISIFLCKFIILSIFYMHLLYRYSISLCKAFAVAIVVSCTAVSGQTQETTGISHNGKFYPKPNAQQAPKKRNFQPYLGAGYLFQQSDYENLPGTNVNADAVIADEYHGAAVHAGIRVNEWLGVEASYNKIFEESKRDDIGGLIKTTNSGERYALDLLGYYPLTRERTIELVGAAGVAHSEYEGSIDFTALGGEEVSGEFENTSWRAGAGLQLNPSDTFGLRGMVYYNDTSDVEGSNYDLDYVLSLLYHF